MYAYKHRTAQVFAVFQDLEFSLGTVLRIWLDRMNSLVLGAGSNDRNH